MGLEELHVIDRVWVEGWIGKGLDELDVVDLAHISTVSYWRGEVNMNSEFGIRNSEFGMPPGRPVPKFGSRNSEFGISDLLSDFGFAGRPNAGWEAPEARKIHSLGREPQEETLKK